jgi:glucosamine--fructose-6-phosphate aminotransferase (isomerizing)
LVNDKISRDLVFDAIAETVKKIEGRFAILVFVEGVDGIFAARRGSPLILGRGKNETFIASDIPAFLKYTNIVNYLDDDEMVWVHQGEVVFQNMKSREIIEKRDIEVPWKEEQAEKGDFPHFMIKEIFEQKETIARAINHSDEDLLKAANLLKDCNGAYFIACGTAHKVAKVAEYYFARISGRKVNVVEASEMPDFERFINEKTAVIAISQSGETADVMEILERSKQKSAKILALTNVESSSMARLADVHLSINAGPEKAVASTKAATSQMALAFLLAYADAEIRGISKLNVGREILRSTAANINDNLNPRYEEHIREIARKLHTEDKLFIIGRGTLYPMALEAAIKIQEVSYIPALAFAAGELKHGPIALIENGTPCIVLGSNPETISNATELKSRGARIIGVSTKNSDIFDEWIRVADCDGAQAIASVIPVQILAYHLAIFRGLDPDMPRNLAKSVTVK